MTSYKKKPCFLVRGSLAVAHLHKQIEIVCLEKDWSREFEAQEQHYPNRNFSCCINTLKHYWLKGGLCVKGVVCGLCIWKVVKKRQTKIKRQRGGGTDWSGGVYRMRECNLKHRKKRKMYEEWFGLQPQTMNTEFLQLDSPEIPTQTYEDLQ